MPEIGNTYTGERTCLPGWMARIWRDKDPVFAGQMQWMWQEQGSFTKPGIGGLYPGLMGYSALMFDPSIPVRSARLGAANGSRRPAPSSAPISRANTKPTSIISRAACISITITTKAPSSSGAKASRSAKTSATMAAPPLPTTAA